MEAALRVFLEQGVLGAVAVLAIGWAIYKERECRRLYESLVDKSEKLTDKYHDAISKMSETVNALTRYEDEDEED